MPPLKALMSSQVQPSGGPYRALIHVKTLHEHKWAAGDVLEVSTVEAEGTAESPVNGIRVVAWPSASLPLHTIQLSAMVALHTGGGIGSGQSLDVCLVAPMTRDVLVEAHSVTIGLPSRKDSEKQDAEELRSWDDAFLGYVCQILREYRYITIGHALEVSYLGKTRSFRVDAVVPVRTLYASTAPATSTATAITINSPTRPVLYQISRETTCQFSTELLRKKRAAAKQAQQLQQPSSSDRTRYTSIGGLHKELQLVREIVELPLQQPEIYQRFGLTPPRGVLLFGPPGTGKTLIAKAVANETGAYVVVINGAEVVSKFYGETENKLRDIFVEAAENAPAIIFIDEIDALCPKREDSQSETEKRIVATLLTLMDGASEKQQQHGVHSRFVVIGATNRPHALDPALRRPGRFDKEVEIGIPDVAGRNEILRVFLSRSPHLLSEEEVLSVAKSTHGYVGADLASLCREAALLALKRHVRAVKGDGSTPPVNAADVPQITLQDLQTAQTMVQPSTMREVSIQVASTEWSDIGGQQETKQRLQESILWPLQHAQAFQKLGIAPPRGILLYGPPGCSKTMLARAVATTSGLNFLAVKGPDVFRKYVGESERMVKEVFRKARAASPCVVFLDEVDALAVRRGGMGGDGGGGSGGGASVTERVLTQLLVELDGIEPLTDVTIIAATNRPDVLDPALLRPGRIDRILYVGPPDYQARLEIMQIQSRKTPLAPDVQLEELARRTEGMSGAEVAAICQEAALYAMEEDPEHVERVAWRHFEQALAKAVPRITPEMLAFYEDFGTSFQQRQ